jgi:hypothetical protein
MDSDLDMDMGNGDSNGSGNTYGDGDMQSVQVWHDITHLMIYDVISCTRTDTDILGFLFTSSILFHFLADSSYFMVSPPGERTESIALVQVRYGDIDCRLANSLLPLNLTLIMIDQLEFQSAFFHVLSILVPC